MPDFCSKVEALIRSKWVGLLRFRQTKIYNDKFRSHFRNDYSIYHFN